MGVTGSSPVAPTIFIINYSVKTFICKYCGKECKNKNSLTQHEIRCKLNPNKIDVSSYIKPGHSKGHKGTNQFIKAQEMGWEKPIVTSETRKKISDKSKLYSHSEEIKEKISLSMKNAVKLHPQSYSSSNVNGRVKHYEYNGYTLDGNWELIVAKYLTSMNIIWVRPTEGIQYYWNNSFHMYFPDFYLPEYNFYIEVKGYERERDLCKYNAVKKIIIIKSKEIAEIKNNTFSIKDKILKEPF